LKKLNVWRKIIRKTKDYYHLTDKISTYSILQLISQTSATRWAWAGLTHTSAPNLYIHDGHKEVARQRWKFPNGTADFSYRYCYCGWL